ncbi:MAG TPA: hypothetical protein VFG01_00430, partial [Acidobacteriota bacterium]|nr:hypothetical protein [Acidobacteriota bacterium]
DRDNNPPGGWIPEQAMTREEALRAATMGGAYVMFAEDRCDSSLLSKNRRQSTGLSAISS